ncbi:DUF4350 domain-containing protein [Nannocystaceae bacterium ST9]
MSATAILIAALLAGEPPLNAPEGERATREILEQDRYYFCQDDNEYVPWLGDQRWCSLAEQEDYRRCPGLRQVCNYDLDLDLGDIDIDFEAEGGEAGDAGEGEREGKANRGARKQRDPVKIELPNLGGFAKVLMWLLLGIAVAAIAYAIYKNLVRGKDEEQPGEEPPPDPGDSLLAAKLAARKVVETDVQRLLARAEAAATKGDHESAIADAYAALLRRLEGESLISVDPWKTNGEHLHDLQAKPQLRDEIRAIVREVEQVQFGAATADGERYASVRRQVLAIVMRAILAIALTLGLGSQLACDPKQESIKALAGLGTGPSGSRAIGELLIQSDIRASHRMAELEQLAQTEGAIVLLEGVALKPSEWTLLLDWVEQDGGTLVIATGGPLPDQLGLKYVPGDGRDLLLPANTYDWYFSSLTLRAPSSWGIEPELRSAGNTEDLLIRPRVDEYDEQTSTWTYMDPQAYAVMQRRGDNEGKVIVFASPDLWTNASLAVADNGTFLVNLFRSRDIDELEFVDDFTGSGPDNPFESVRDSKMWALFLQIALLLGLLYAAVGIPFARLRDPTQRRRRSFVEHVETLGQRYAQNRAARHVAALYSNWALDRMRERLQPGGAVQGLFPLAQAIAARTGRDEGQVMQLLVQAHDLREDQGAQRGTPADLELMRELSKLLAETGSAR